MSPGLCSSASSAFSHHPLRECVPSQNGLRSERPQRQSANGFFGGSIVLPSASSSVTGPVTRYGPFLRTVIVVAWGVSLIGSWSPHAQCLSPNAVRARDGHYSIPVDCLA